MKYILGFFILCGISSKIFLGIYLVLAKNDASVLVRENSLEIEDLKPGSEIRPSTDASLSRYDLESNVFDPFTALCPSKAYSSFRLDFPSA